MSKGRTFSDAGPSSCRFCRSLNVNDAGAPSCCRPICCSAKDSPTRTVRSWLGHWQLWECGTFGTNRFWRTHLEVSRFLLHAHGRGSATAVTKVGLRRVVGLILRRYQAQTQRARV